MAAASSQHTLPEEEVEYIKSLTKQGLENYIKQIRKFWEDAHPPKPSEQYASNRLSAEESAQQFREIQALYYKLGYGQK